MRKSFFHLKNKWRLNVLKKISFGKEKDLEIIFE